MGKIKFLFSFQILSLLLTSCSKIAPAGFWTNFHKDLIVNNNSDQGLYGGIREITWESEINRNFNSTEVIKFAENNDWKIIDSLTFNKDSSKMKSISELKIELFSRDFLREKVLLNIKINESKIYIFKTNWLLVEPGNSRETFQNGFVVINPQKTKFKMIHFWGE